MQKRVPGVARRADLAGNAGGANFDFQTLSLLVGTDEPRADLKIRAARNMWVICDVEVVTLGMSHKATMMRYLGGKIGIGIGKINLYRNRVGSTHNFVFEGDFKICIYGQI